jgi:hypothetical protein
MNHILRLICASIRVAYISQRRYAGPRPFSIDARLN